MGMTEAASATGTPPHAWGKHLARPFQVDGCRYTPTRVGKTNKRSRHVMRLAVHPHTRGENLKGKKGGLLRVGTPPHAWGKPLPLRDCYHTYRYTPTRVGKNAALETGSARSVGTPPHAWGKNSATLLQLHRRVRYTPHTRGENAGSRDAVEHLRGTPPHTRGENDFGRCHNIASHRYTPTRVGKTWVKRLM